MNVYIYQAALLCEDCGLAKQNQLDHIATDHGNATFYYRDDSDKYPQGPYGDGGGEADCPQHCDHCGIFLKNSLTGDGITYLQEKVGDFECEGFGRASVIHEWIDFYGTLAYPANLFE